MRTQHLQQLLALLERKVNRQHSVDSSVRHFRRKLLESLREDEVVVREEHEPRLWMVLAHALRERDHVVDRHALPQRLVCGGAYHAAVSERIGERHAKLHYVRAGRYHAVYRLLAFIETWKSDREIGHERAAVF